jgi:hypothetical protein
MHGRGLIALAAALTLTACEDASYLDIGAQIGVLTERTDALVPPAILRLTRFGRRAIPQIEIALHTASPSGKANLLRAVDGIADPEAAAILRHFAVYDPVPAVRSTCEEILTRWSRRAELAPAATRALARIAEKRARGEAPLVRGEPAPPGPR